MILAIDPGNIESAYVFLNEKNKLQPKEFDKIPNESLLHSLKKIYFTADDYVVIEMVACYGMPVGKEVFDTCVWIGKFIEAVENETSVKVKLIYRKDEKMNLCGTMKANDSNITQALVDRFAYGVRNHGKGTKKEPGWFYGFSKDVWQAYAVGVTCYDLYLKGD